ncbi:MAG: GNAT family N-acetyltransferase [Caldilineaceae bacterium]|nr:GNAT family N-acetyltransferase [Caldilineaceae bacterium]
MQISNQSLAQLEQQWQAQLPSGYQLRPPTLADVPATVAMLNASALDTVGTPQFTEDEFEADWQEPGFTLATDSRLILAPDGQVAAMTDIVFRTPYVRHFVWGRVHPQHRGLGLGTILNHWAAARIHERLPEAPPDARVIMECSNVSTHHAADALLTGLGYTHIRTFSTMRIEMAGPPPPPVWPAGITIRTMIPNQDEAALYRAKDEAFHDHWGHVETPFEEGYARWLHHIQHNSDHDPTLFFLAMAGDEIAGYALCEPTTADDPGMAWVDNLGVRRPWRRQGLALALLHHLFGEFYRRGITRVGLGVDASSLTGASRLYERAGMQSLRQYNSYEKEIRPGRNLMRH